jgi:arylsulfatase A-like enzyme
MLFITALQPAFAQKKPNIILILADDLGYGDLGAYGQKLIYTPNIDALAAGGMRFTNYYSGSTVCAPSRETLLTGMHTGHTEIRGNFLTNEEEDPPLPSDKMTIAEYLKKAGYETALFGKWGLGGETHGPETQGFDNSFCYLDQIKAHEYYAPFLYENGRKVNIKGNENGAHSVYSHNLFASKTLDYVNGRTADKPFFLYLPFTIPHGAYTLPPDTPYVSKDWPGQFKTYATMVSLLDRDIGRIIQALKQKGLYDNTLIFFTSDNGANTGVAKFFNSNGLFTGSKFGFYEGGIHVPLIASWKGKIQPATESNHITASWDILPTICNAAGIKPPPGIDGISFLPTLTNKKQNDHEFLYWEYYDYNYNWNKPNNQLPRNYFDSRAVRLGKWKAIQKNMYKDKNAPIELYDLNLDPQEKNNIAGEHLDVVNRVREIFATSTIAGSPYFPFKK